MDGTLGTALERDLDEAWVTAMEAAQQVDGVGHVAPGVTAGTFEQVGEVWVARGAFACNAGELGRGNADRCLFD